MSGELLYVRDVSPYRRDGRVQVAGVHQSLTSAALALEEIAGLCQLSFRHVARAADASLEQLASARLLVLFTIGETPWSAEQQRVIEERAADGTLGLVGLHSATDSAYGWSGLGDLIGARFDGHPVTRDLPITVLDRSHPATAHLPSPWWLNEELYLFRDLAADARLLLGVQFRQLPPDAAALAAANLRDPPDKDDGPTLPLAWCIERGLTRVFYTALGHFVSAYEDVAYLQHLRGGIEWVLSRSGNGEFRP